MGRVVVFEVGEYMGRVVVFGVGKRRIYGDSCRVWSREKENIWGELSFLE